MTHTEGVVVGDRELISGGPIFNRQIFACPEDEARILPRDQAKQDGLRRRRNDSCARLYFSDVRDAKPIADAMVGVGRIFHPDAFRREPASNLADWAGAVARVLGDGPEVHVIGTRSPDMSNEPLLSRQRTAEAEDWGDYCRVPLDGRAVNVGTHVEQGTDGIRDTADRTSHCSRRLTAEEVAGIVKGQSGMQEALGRAGE